MLRTLRFAVGAVAILAGSVALAQAPNSDLFPLKAKSKWIYKLPDGQEVTVLVVGNEKVGNEDYVKLDVIVGGQTKASELYAVKADGVYRAKVKDDKIDPPVKILALPAKKGETWRIDSKVGTQAVKGEFKITDDKVKVKIAGGDLEAILVEAGDIDVAGTKTSLKQWFVAGKGIVKTTFSIQGTESALELKEYVEGK